MTSPEESVYQNSPKKSASLKPGEIPSEYVKAGPRSTDYYYVSEDALPWPQAQYECQSRSGRLAELGRIDRNLIEVASDYIQAY